MKLSRFRLVFCFLGGWLGSAFANNLEVPVKRSGVEGSVDEKIGELQERIQEINGVLEEILHRLQSLEGDTVVVSPSSKLTSSNQSSKNELEKLEQQLYQEALSHLPNNPQVCVTRLREYLEQYPNGKYVVNSRSWLGELNRMQNNLDAAEEEFRIILTQFPEALKIDEIKFKLALVYYAQGRKELAGENLRQLVAQTSNSSIRQLAKQQLRQWKM